MVASSTATERERASTELGRALRAVMAAARRLRGRDAQRPGEVSYAQYSLLFALAEHGELPAGELACVAALSPASVTEMLDHLAGMGLVVRTRSERDRRVVVSRLADAGQAVVAARHARIAPQWDAALAEFSEEQLRAAAAVLERLREFFEGLDEQELG